ncbi:glutathione S-transferase U7 isoform X2 [Ricinus communis]|uniref:glutathione S-transferase U7 isoform X2 n=1 Tax=Ricinus communis TaxID=3988 RepID=UPI000772742A|nr:glutathione S-transferase U7 isoform X2 [Ricinus communis]|eukprot:XP_015575541.1 glutathione S-transferase U7 isoform X2 [Ricinus communis]
MVEELKLLGTWASPFSHRIRLALKLKESLVILEYIDQTWKHHPLLPKDPYDRAIARFWAKFVDEKILQTALKGSAATGKEKEQVIEEVDQYLKLLVNELKDNDFFGGESIGYLDIVAFSIFYFFEGHQVIMRIKLISEEKVPVLYKWMERLCERDVICESLPPKDKHLGYFVAPTEAAKSVSKCRSVLLDS